MIPISSQIRSLLKNTIRLQPNYTLSYLQIRPNSTKSNQINLVNNNKDKNESTNLKTKPEKPLKHQPKTLLEGMEEHKKMINNFKSNLPPWIKRDLTQKSKYERWNPQKKLTRQEMIKLKELKETFPQYRTIDLAQFFHISPEAVRRILKSKWVPNDVDEDRIMKRKEKQMIQRQEAKRDESARKINRFGNSNRSSLSTNHRNKKPDRDNEEFNSNYNRIQSKF
ncbi:RRG9 [Candida jiufengensis]|uniref:RRG9 n=1 Tax=Candida jiufengensis TaxID=497108 RepID=UPI002224726D|nr:RRG9 [Candida jiufengensis]KAI5952504.1 RRG9 [Candida jiufengensis]